MGVGRGLEGASVECGIFENDITEEDGGSDDTAVEYGIFVVATMSAGIVEEVFSGRGMLVELLDRNSVSNPKVCFTQGYP